MSRETAHQLGTPISSLMGWVELLNEKENDLRKIIPEMKSDIKRLENISDKFNKIGSKPILKSVDISCILKEVLDFFNSKVSESNRSTIYLSAKEGMFVNGDKILLYWAIENIIKNHPEIEVILLDDGFQHRRIKAGFNLLITEYNLPYYKDFLLPMGTLRENKKGSERANIIVVSKAPKLLNPTEKKGIIQQLGVFITQQCYFSHIHYQDWRCLTTNNILTTNEKYSITLVTAIANATPLLEMLKNSGHTVTHIKYANHHHYTLNDMENILNNYRQDNSAKKLILTTEKDAVKLRKFENEFGDANVYYAPIEVGFEEKENFEKQILNYVRSNKRNS